MDNFTVLSIPEISNERQIWLIRTNGGLYYNDFTTNKYVALGWDAVSVDFTDTQLLSFLVITFKHQCSFDVVFKPTESAIVAVIQSLPVNICIKICIIKI